MKRVYFMVLSVLVFATVIGLASYAQANMIISSGFEAGNTENWAHWCVSSAVTDAEKHSGTYSVELNLPAEYDKGALIQEVKSDFSAGGPLYASGWVKTDNLDADAFLKLEFWSKEGAQLSSVESKKITAADNWKNVSVSVPSVPDGTAIVKFLVQLNSTTGKGSSGKLYFDDAYLDTTAGSAGKAY